MPIKLCAECEAKPFGEEICPACVAQVEHYMGARYAYVHAEARRAGMIVETVALNPDINRFANKATGEDRTARDQLVRDSLKSYLDRRGGKMGWQPELNGAGTPPLIVISVALEPELHKRASASALRAETTVAQLIRDALAERFGGREGKIQLS